MIKVIRGETMNEINWRVNELYYESNYFIKNNLIEINFNKFENDELLEIINFCIKHKIDLNIFFWKWESRLQDIINDYKIEIINNNFFRKEKHELTEILLGLPKMSINEKYSVAKEICNNENDIFLLNEAINNGNCSIDNLIKIKLVMDNE